MKQSEMTEQWECWMMANNIWGAGERELLASLLQSTSQRNSHWSPGASSFLLEESGVWDCSYKIKNSQFLKHQCSCLPKFSLSYSSLQIFFLFLFRANGKFSRTGSFPEGLILKVEVIRWFKSCQMKLAFAYPFYRLNSAGILSV